MVQSASWFNFWSVPWQDNLPDWTVLIYCRTYLPIPGALQGALISLVFKILSSDGGCCCCCEENWAKGSFRHSQLSLIHFCAIEGSSSKRCQPEVIGEEKERNALQGKKGRTIGSVCLENRA